MLILVVYLLSVMGMLKELDVQAFIFIHATASSENLDWLMLALRNALTWIPLYGFLLYWIIRYRIKYAWQLILASLVVFAITDHVSASVLKPYFGRLRPCHDPALAAYMRGLLNCGGQYGMPSSHASNHFGLASFWYLTLTMLSNRKWWWWLWVWAAIICYAQVYVGKHYPGDIVAGAVFGSAVGISLALLFRRLVPGLR